MSKSSIFHQSIMCRLLDKIHIFIALNFRLNIIKKKCSIRCIYTVLLQPDPQYTVVVLIYIFVFFCCLMTEWVHNSYLIMSHEHHMLTSSHSQTPAPIQSLFYNPNVISINPCSWQQLCCVFQLQWLLIWPITEKVWGSSVRRCFTKLMQCHVKLKSNKNFLPKRPPECSAV